MFKLLRRTALGGMTALASLIGSSAMAVEIEYW